MRQMWLGVKFFCGKPGSVGKKKIGELSTEEIQEIMDNTIPVTATKKGIKFGMRIINGTYPFKFPLKAVKLRLSMGISDEIDDATIAIDETKISEIEVTKRRFRYYCVQTKYW